MIYFGRTNCESRNRFEDVLSQAIVETEVQVYYYIISNALKYSDGDFSVNLSENGEIIFSNRAERLDAVTAEKLFNRFCTVENTRNSTGLGLSIAKLLTERIGGSIKSDYKDNRFYISVTFRE